MALANEARLGNALLNIHADESGCLDFGKMFGLDKSNVRPTASNSTHAQLQAAFEGLADSQLLPKYRAIDPNLKAGYTGSFRTGVVGNPTKATFGQPIDLSNFDIDYWIASDVLQQRLGANLRADVEFRQILSETPGFEGLKPNKQGFSIKFKPSSGNP